MARLLDGPELTVGEWRRQEYRDPRTSKERRLMIVPDSVTPGVLLFGVRGRSPEEWLQFGTLILTRGIEVIGALIIAVGVLKALGRWIGQHLPGGQQIATESIRLGLGRSLGLALEFLLAADILSTAVAPTWDAIGKLAAIATIRTLLNYFLGRELETEQRRAGTGSARETT